MGNLFWIASYPKSGNTWVRLFIRALLEPESGCVDMNKINVGDIASSREWIQSALDFDIEELSHDEVERLRPVAYQWLSDQTSTLGYHKVHDAYRPVSGSDVMFPASATRGVLYLIRNPLDVTVSYSHHLQKTLDQTISELNNSEACFGARNHKLNMQLRQKLGSWSEHVMSWLQYPKQLIKFVRYEDMVTNSVEVFCGIAEFLQLPCSRKCVTKALAACSFDKLKEQEKNQIFREKPEAMPNFFRKGVVDQWCTKLTTSQVQRVIREHHQVMESFGYLENCGERKQLFQYENKTVESLS